MQIIFNNCPYELAEPFSLTHLLQQKSDVPKKFAIAVNGVFVPKALYESTCLQPADVIDVIVPMQGG